MLGLTSWMTLIQRNRSGAQESQECFFNTCNHCHLTCAKAKKYIKYKRVQTRTSIYVIIPIPASLTEACPMQ